MVEYCHRNSELCVQEDLHDTGTFVPISQMGYCIAGFFRSAKFSFKAEIIHFRLLRAHMHHTPSHINIHVGKYSF